MIKLYTEKKALLFLCCLLNTGIANAADVFKIKGRQQSKQSLVIEACSDTVVSLPGCSQPVFGLSLDMSIRHMAPDYFVRIVLEGTKGEKYVVAETYLPLGGTEEQTFSGYCEETAILDGITPKSLNMYIRNANVSITSVNLSNKRASANSRQEYDSLRLLQLNSITTRINTYNRIHDKLWAAGVTELSKRPFSEKMSILDIPESEPTEGMEYYVGGVFEMGQPDGTQVRDASPYIAEFDWRNRHGKNWISPFKDQGSSGFCSAFAAIGAVEALVNIYNNHIYNLNLSEQEAACCNGSSDPYHHGMSPSAPLSYIKTYGVCDEAAYPFVDDSLQAYCRSDEVTPNTLVKISNYRYVSGSWDDVKDALIHEGPLSSGYWRNSGGHSMALIGYKTLQVGDTIRIMESGSNYYTHVMEPDDPRLGMTCWVFKNSYANVGSGFQWRIFPILFYNRSNMVGPYALGEPLVTLHPTDVNEICEDADGDGYYYWGIGDRPDDIPSWAMDEPDGDDSDINHGPMDQYGNLEQLTPGITINSPETYSGSQTLSSRIGIVSGGSLTVTGTLTLTSNTKIRVCEGGVLIIDGGSIINANIEMIHGSTLVIRNNGSLSMASGQSFYAPLGAVVNIENGVIE